MILYEMVGQVLYYQKIDCVVLVRPLGRIEQKLQYKAVEAGRLADGAAPNSLGIQAPRPVLIKRLESQRPSSIPLP